MTAFPVLVGNIWYPFRPVLANDEKASDATVTRASTTFEDGIWARRRSSKMGVDDGVSAVSSSGLD
ncbi:hypothetical protein EA462_08685 [Natrarchaeobius halalkaliphilus]|uniref:Uncharacterized protein n=1 Tax=Natrarchaeobius halalkaliphilus TaxID=1679091 RepID=A0A3N6M984_9EURY|nr:hypothetical protein EA462_08685 [Natrarchaeobius halalkaliphilus]